MFGYNQRFAAAGPDNFVGRPFTYGNAPRPQQFTQQPQWQVINFQQPVRQQYQRAQGPPPQYPQFQPVTHPNNFSQWSRGSNPLRPNSYSTFNSNPQFQTNTFAPLNYGPVPFRHTAPAQAPLWTPIIKPTGMPYNHNQFSYTVNNFQGPGSCSESVISAQSSIPTKNKKKKPKQKQKKLVQKKQAAKLRKPKVVIKKAINAWTETWHKNLIIIWLCSLSQHFFIAVQEVLKKSLDPFQALKTYLSSKNKDKFGDIVKITKQIIKSGASSTTRHKIAYRGRVFAATKSTKKVGVAKNRCAKKLLRYIAACEEVDLWEKYQDMQ